MTAPTTPTDHAVLPVARLLMVHLGAALAAVSRPPRATMMRVGTQMDFLLSTSRDECCEGVGWVRPVSIYPSGTFPVQDIEPVRCGPYMYAVVLEMGVARCAPTPGPNEIPSGADWDAVSTLVYEDAAAMRRAVSSWRQELANAPEGTPLHLLGPWQPLSNEGRCAGGLMNLTVSVPNCD